MLLKDIYYKQHFKHSSKQFYNNKYFKELFPDNLEQWNYKTLNDINVPTNAQIAQAQKTAAKTFFTNAWGERYLEKLNEDIVKPLQTIKFQQEVSEQIDKVQKSLEFKVEKDEAGNIVNYALGWLKGDKIKNSDQLVAIFKKNEKALRHTLDDLKQIYDLFQTKKSQKIVPFPKKVITQLSNLQNVINQLEMDLNGIKNNSQYTIDIKSRFSKVTGNMGYLASTANIGYELQGFLLPLIFQEKVKEMAIEKGQALIDTGAWRSQAGELPIDLVYGTVGKNEVFDDLLAAFEKMKKSPETYTMVIEDYDATFNELKQSTMGLIQAKSNRLTPAPTGFQISPNQIINTSNNQANALIRLIKLKQTHHARIYVTHEHYNAFFNYELHRFMRQILGVENNIILTPQGISTLGDWVEKNFNENYFFQSYYNISLNKSNKEQSIVAKSI